MDRRTFLQGMALSAASVQLLDAGVASDQSVNHPMRKTNVGNSVSVDGFTLLSEFAAEETKWKVYEDLRTRDGALVFLSSSGITLALPKNAEASFPEGTPYVGLALKDVGLSSADLLADQLLRDGDPDP